MRLIATIVTLLLVLASSHAPVAAADEEPSVTVSAICAFEVSAAAQAKVASEAPTAAPGGKAAVPEPLPDDWLDAAIRSCGSLDDWLGAHLLYPEALGTADPVVFVRDRCLGAAAELGPYATCRSVGIALATPAPVADTADPGEVVPAPEVEVKPVEPATPATTDASKGPKAKVSKKLKATIPGATEIRYFRIRGDTPFKLLAQNQVRSVPHCGNHQAIACVSMSWTIDVTKEWDDATRKCSLKRVRTKLRSVVYLPQWVDRPGADPVLVRWWRKVLTESAVHEAEHIRIQQQHLAEFRREATGKSCGSATFFANQHGARANLAQAAFDEIEYQKPLPPIPLSLLE